MGFALAFVLIGVGSALIYKGYKGWDWPTLYTNLFGGGQKK